MSQWLEIQLCHLLHAACILVYSDRDLIGMILCRHVETCTFFFYIISNIIQTSDQSGLYVAHDAKLACS